MKRAHAAAWILAAAALAGAAFLLGRSSVHPEMSAPTVAAASAPAASGAGRKVLYWHDPMVPGPALRQAGQVAVHGHAARAGVCGQRRRERRQRQPRCAAEPGHPDRDGPARRDGAVVRGGRRRAVRRAPNVAVQTRVGRLRRAPGRARADGAGAQGPGAGDGLRARLARRRRTSCSP